MVKEPINLYIGIWGMLVGITILEVLMVLVNMPIVFLITGVLLLAGLKAAFVALYYQHLKWDDVAISWFYLMALFFALFIVMVWTGGSAVCQVEV